MRYYEIMDPRDPLNDDFRPLIRIWSEKQILDWYYPSWQIGMRRRGRHNEITENNFLDDFIVVHWANYIGDF